MNLRNSRRDVVVGAFIALALIIFAWATIRVSDRTSVSGRGYEVTILVDNATGLKKKAPIELAGVQVGVVKDIELSDSRMAKVILSIDPGVKLPIDSKAVLRTRGFLGETYVELLPGSEAKYLSDRGEIVSVGRSGDVNSLVSNFNDIAADIKEVTAALKEIIAQEGSPIRQTADNIEKLSALLKSITMRNEANFDRIAYNLAEVSEQMRAMLSRSKQDVEEAMAHISSIAGKVDRGEGSLGKLVNDEETVEKLDEAIDNLNQTLGGFKRLEAEIGYHAEYLADSKDFKHYVSLALKPSPDKAFLLDVVSDPNPNPRHVEKTTDITVGGTTSTVKTHTATIDRSAVRISAQLAKKLNDLTFRGGIIESTGGLGLDYDVGPVQASFSAYNFSTRYGERPHLKAWATLHMTKNLYVMGGADDIINPKQKVDYFVGAGFRLVDEDIKSVFSLGKSVIK